MKGVITPFYGDKGLRVVYARGRYEQSVLPDIRGQAIIFMHYGENDAATAEARPRDLHGGVRAWLDSGMIASLAGSLAKAKATSEARHALKVFARLSNHLELPRRRGARRARPASRGPARGARRGSAASSAASDGYGGVARRLSR